MHEERERERGERGERGEIEVTCVNVMVQLLMRRTREVSAISPKAMELMNTLHCPEPITANRRETYLQMKQKEENKIYIVFLLTK